MKIKCSSVLRSTLLLLGVHAICPVQASPAEIYLVRHAEKQQDPHKDPALSACGQAQAKAMATLIQQPLSVVYHSGYQRTEQTASLMASAFPQAEIKAYNPRDLAQLAAEIQLQTAPVLVVGHSNTTVELIVLLSQLNVPVIDEQDYGVVYHLQKDSHYQLKALPIQQPTMCNPSTT